MRLRRILAAAGFTAMLMGLGLSGGVASAATEVSPAVAQSSEAAPLSFSSNGEQWGQNDPNPPWQGNPGFRPPKHNPPWQGNPGFRIPRWCYNPWYFNHPYYYWYCKPRHGGWPHH